MTEWTCGAAVVGEAIIQIFTTQTFPHEHRHYYWCCGGSSWKKSSAAARDLPNDAFWQYVWATMATVRLVLDGGAEIFIWSIDPFLVLFMVNGRPLKQQRWEQPHTSPCCRRVLIAAPSLIILQVLSCNNFYYPCFQTSNTSKPKQIIVLKVSEVGQKLQPTCFTLIKLFLHGMQIWHHGCNKKQNPL